MSRRGWAAWTVVGFVVAAVGGAAAWVDLDSADKIGSVVGAGCGALGLVLSAYSLVKSRQPHLEQPAAARVDPVDVGSVENVISGSTVAGPVVQAESVDGPLVIGESNIVGDHNQVHIHTIARHPARAAVIGAWSPFDLDIHHSITAGTDNTLPELPRYILREHDEELNRLLRSVDRSLMIVLVGGSSTGKTRALYEAVNRHAMLSTWPVTYVRSPLDLVTLLRAERITPRTVLWLNETQNYLAGEYGDEIAAGLRCVLDGSAPGPVVVLGTLWPDYWHELTDITTANRSRGRPLAKELLHQATHRINVADRFNDEQLKALRTDAGIDPRVAKAAATAGNQGQVIQTLAGGPLLVSRYEHPDTPQDRYAAAVLSAAIDARRLGHRGPLTCALLEAAAVAYLNTSDSDIPANWFVEGLHRASRNHVHGVTALTLCRRSPDEPADSYLLHDFLAQHGRMSRRNEPTTVILWNALLAHTHAAGDQGRLAKSAADRLLYRYAEPLYRKAAADGTYWGRSGLGSLLIEQNRVEDAVAFLHECATAGDSRAGERLIEALRDHTLLIGTWPVRADELTDRAMAALRARTEGGDEWSGEVWARLMVQQQRTLEAIAFLRERDAAGVAWARLLWQRLQVDHYDEATRALQDLNRYASSAWARDQRTRLRARQQEVENDVLTYLRERTAAGDTYARYQLAELLVDHGSVDEAIVIIRSLEQAHWLTERAAERLIRDGRVEDAITFLEECLDLGDESVSWLLAKTLADHGLIGKLRDRADAGDEKAAWWLAILLLKRGDVDQLRARTLEGDGAAAERLPTALIRAGRLREARELIRNRATPDDAAASNELVQCLLRASRTDDAIEFLRERVATGDRTAGSKLENVLAAHGRLDDAIALLRDRVDIRKGRGAVTYVNILAEHDRLGAALNYLLSRAVDEGDTLAAVWLRALQADIERLTTLRLHAKAGDSKAREQFRRLLAQHAKTELLRERNEEADSRLGHIWGRDLASLLSQRGELKALSELADEGNQSASSKLADRLADGGHEDELRTRADAGDWFAQRRIVKLWLQQGRVDAAITYLETQTSHVSDLVKFLADHGHIDKLRRRASIGERESSRALLGLAWRAELPDAECLLRWGLNVDGTTASQTRQ